MTILREVIQSIQKINTLRPPVSSRFGQFSRLNEQMGLISQLSQPATVPWIFAVVDRIATSVASVEWRLEKGLPNGDKRQVTQHPLLLLWNNWNPWMTHEEGLEIVQQHLSLTGEGWIIKLRDTSGITRELWPVRPDRMSVVPSPDKYIAGYVYQIENEKIPLAVEDVVFIRHPNPLDSYRGLGPLQSLMSDLQGEKAASRYNMFFFQNNAEPGGILQFEENISDADFERLVTRWNAQHRGVSNAHRVAVIERGTWVERKYTQKDMEFIGLRNFTRDLILGAFGVPRAAMGITEDVNRANAEAGMFLFSHWVVRPQLRRLRAAINDRLVDDFGDDLELNFLDPTPENKEANLAEAVQGYREGLLTLNEGRALLGESEVSEGDTFRAPAPAPVSFSLSKGALWQKALESDPEHIRPEDVDRIDLRMGHAWKRRLNAEMNELLDRLEELHKQIESSDIDGHDWDWWRKYGEEVTRELEQAFAESALAMFPNAGPDLVQLRAASYAEVRAASLLKVAGDLNLVEHTKERVRELVAENLRTGQSLGDLAKKIRADEVFSPSRARTIARTETATALGQGQKQTAIVLGRNEKRWITQGDELVRPEHSANEAQGWIPVNELFSNGEDTISAPNCRCTVIFRTGEKGFTPIKTDFPLENHCPFCKKLLAKNGAPAERYCGRCKKQVIC